MRIIRQISIISLSNYLSINSTSLNESISSCCMFIAYSLHIPCMFDTGDLPRPWFLAWQLS